MTDRLEIIPIGGLGEFGMNSMVIRYGDEMIVVDAGLMFPDVNHLGVDIIVPDYNYLNEHRDQLRALVLTHSHEDHIGSVPYLLKTVNVPVYATPYTAAVLASKLDEHGLSDEVLVHTVRPHNIIELGPFSIEFIHVSHSTTGCAALAISTPVGVIIHTGDFKFDETPVCGEAIDMESLRRYGDQGVLALLSDSTNIERPGRMHSEKAVVPAFEDIFDKARGRIIVSCFTSSIHRIQIVFDLAEQFDRKVAVIGRSMIRNIDVAESTRYLDISDGATITPADAKRLAPEDVVLLVTGCQGEPMAALSRMAVDNHKQAKVELGDTVILSARQIPGNEKSISRLINHLYKRQAIVYDSTRARVHVSGHGSQDDLRMMLELTRPKFFIPIHGEYRQLYQHKEFAVKQLGYLPERVVLVESGDIIELDGESVYVTNKVPIGRIFIDSTGTGEIEDLVVRDRKHLAYDGIVLPILAINPHTGKVEIKPEVVTRGFNIPDGDENYLTRLSDLVSQTISGSSEEERCDWAVLKEKIRIDLKRFIQRGTGRRPMIIPVILEI